VKAPFQLPFGGIFTVYRAHVGGVRNHGPVTTYGASDMVIDRSSRERPLGVTSVGRRPGRQTDNIRFAPTADVA
jgi:hypothetical protein